MSNKIAFVFAIAIIFSPLQLSGQLPEPSNTDYLKIEKVEPQPPSVPKLIFPVDGAWLKSMLVVFKWNSGELSIAERSPLSSFLSSATGYILEISKSISFVKPVIIDTVTSTYVYKVLYEGRYYWRVKAFDLAGNESDFSSPDSFGIDITYPSEPSLVSPIDSSFIQSRTPEFIWSAATDNLSGIDHYVLQYADHPNLNYGAISVNVKDTTYTPLSPLYDTTYYWRVTAVDKANNKGCWTSRWIFTITTAGCPDIPTPLFPPHLSYINDITPTFIWTKEGGPGVRYSLQYALDEYFQSARITIDSIFDTVYTVTTPLLDTTYYWRVEAINPFGCHSGWSVPFAFTIDTTLPSIPTLISPPDHSVMCYNRPQFVWTHTAEAGGHYTLQYAFDSSFTQGVVTITNLSDTIYTVLDTLADTTYYWHVEAIDYAGNHSGYQPHPFTFTIYTKLPDIPVLISPEDSSHINDNTPTFVWTCTGDVGITYTLEYTPDSTFTSNVVRVFNINDTTYTIPSALALIDGTYYWRVEAIDQAGCRSGYQAHPFMFTIETELPDIPILIAPECASLLNDNTPNFVWSSTAGPSGSYILQYALNSNFTQGVVTITDISDTSYTVVDALEDATYYWRVEAIDEAGNHSGYQPYPCMFTIDTGPPVIPVLIQPPDNASINDRTPEFVWSSTVSPNGSYTLQYSGNQNFYPWATITIENLTETNYTLPDTLALPDGNYYWRVEATDEAGNHSGYQLHPFMFTIDTWPPDKPDSLIAPPCDTTINSNTVQFVWSSVSGCATYVLEYALNSTFTIGVVTISNITDTTYTRTIPDGIYYWRVEAVDYAGNHSGYTDPCKLIIDTQGPCPPTLIAPPDHSAMCYNKPRFVWTPTAGSGGYYILQWALDSLFTQSVTTIESIPYNQSHYQVTSPLGDTTWYWHVEAVDYVDNHSGYQTHPFRFTVDTKLPAKPALILPPNNDTTNNNVPTFVWSTVAGAVCYTLQYAKNSTFSQDVVTITNLTDTVYTAQTILADGDYYWRVEAIDRAGCHSGYQDIYHIFKFTIDTEAPCPPTLLSPCDVVINDNTPTFVWSANLALGEGTYILQYARDSMFTQDVVTISGIVNNNYTVPDTQALSDGTWYWHVEAVDQAGNHSGYQLSPCMFTIGVVACEPSEVTISKYDTDKLLLEWTPTCCTYNVYRDTIPCDTLKIPIATNITDTFYIDSTPGIVGNPDINYYYYVTGICNGIESDPSNQVGEFDFRLITSTPTSYNDISIPLHKAGLDSASDVAADIGPNCSSIAKWVAENQSIKQYIVGVPGSEDFQVFVGYPYRVYMLKDTIWTLTGDVPAPCSVSFDLITSTPTSYNDIAIPLCNTTALDSASDVAADIGPNCSSIAKWVAENQSIKQYIVGVPGSEDFQVFVGYPYRVYMLGHTIWPSCGGKGALASSYGYEINHETVTGLNAFVSHGHHLVSGYLRNVNNEVPKEVYFKAYITSRPEEILTQASPGCRYADGIWTVQIANFPSPWKARDILHVDFSDRNSNKVSTVNVTLTWSDYDQAEDVILGEKPEEYIEIDVPEKIAISQNYPNPFSNNTEINYNLSKDLQISLKIYNIVGQCVKTLVDEYKQAGHYKVKWDGKTDDGQEVVNGIYIYSIIAGEYKNTKRMLLIR